MKLVERHDEFLVAIQEDSNALANNLKRNRDVERWQTVITEVKYQNIMYIRLVCVLSILSRILV